MTVADSHASRPLNLWQRCPSSMTVAVSQKLREQGQLDRDEVAPSTLPPERLRTGLQCAQHLLGLSSVQDDGLGEELNLISELEPRVRDRGTIRAAKGCTASLHAS